MVIVVDVNRPSYTECPALLDKASTIVVLDHHRQGGEVIRKATLSYIEPYASSASEMAAEVLQYFSENLKLRPIEAETIYAGIVMDTDNFVAKTGVRTALIMSVAATAVLGLTVLLLSHQLLGFFSPVEEVVAYGARFLRIATPFYVLLCFNQILSGALRGTGDATVPTVIMLGSFVVFRQIYLYITHMLNLGFVSVALAYPMGWVVCSTLLIIRYLRSPLGRGIIPDEK
jgi:hypothetical protein